MVSGGFRFILNGCKISDLMVNLPGKALKELDLLIDMLFMLLQQLR